MHMNEIITVLGKISPSDMGFCQCHEHLLLSKGKSFENNPALCMDDIQKSTRELKSYKLAGGKTVVDAQPIGCGRMTEELASISAGSKVNIISSTGFHKLCFYPEDHWIHKIGVHNLAGIFTLELTNGMFVNTECHSPDRQCRQRAGIVKAALDREGLTPRYKNLFQSAAAAALKTNRPMMIHVEHNTDPLLLLDYLLSLGMSPSRLIFCHLDRACPYFDVHLKIAASGAYLEYDTIGRFKYHSNDQEIQLIKQIIQNGYEKQLLISLDTTNQRMKAYNSNAIGLDYILKTFIPQMHSQGIKENQTRLFNIDNPIHAFL